MASSSQPGAAAQGTDITALKAGIYDKCAEAAKEIPKMVFRQATIFELNKIPNNDVLILLQVTQALVDEKLFKIVHDSDGMGWRLRSVEEAKKYRSLKPEHEIVYSLIDEAGDEGLWTKTIKARANLHDTTFNSAIKHLESKNMISNMKSVEHPARKMYIKSSLRPSERATGGPWYTDGELDDEFVAQIMNILFNYIRKKTFYHSSSGAVKKPKKTKKLTTEEAKALRDKSLGPRAKTEEIEDAKISKKREVDRYLPMPAGYQEYATLHEMTLYIDRGNFTEQILTANDIQLALDIMCYDDRIEKVFQDGVVVAYKALRKNLMDQDEIGSVIREAPCGRCPVFDLCEEGGPVGPSNCEYFSDWLSL